MSPQEMTPAAPRAAASPMVFTRSNCKITQTIGEKSEMALHSVYSTKINHKITITQKSILKG